MDKTKLKKFIDLFKFCEDNAQEVRNNPDGSITYIFDEPGLGSPPPTSSTTFKKEVYDEVQKALRGKQ